MRASRVVIVPRAEGSVTVWVHEVGLDVPAAEVERREAVLSVEERARAAEYRFPRDRDRFIVGRASLRRVLAAHGAGDAARLVLGTGAFGKPELKARSTLRFNVTHTGDWALVAVADGVEVGIDLEQVRPLRDVISVARRTCTDAEVAVLAALPPDSRHIAFLRCWVRKEACAKAVGLGLWHRLEDFEVGVGSTARTEPMTVSFPRAFPVMLSDLDVGDGNVAALAVEAPR